MVKKYRHKTGFSDDTDYVEIDEQNQVVVVSKYGERLPVTSDVRIFLDFIKQGSWVEVNE